MQLLAEEPPAEVENAILRGLRYLVREALASRLHSLAEVIATAVHSYEKGKTSEQRQRH